MSDLKAVYEGFSESYYELYRDFEDIIKKAAEFGCELLKAENLNEQAVEQAARSGLIINNFIGSMLEGCADMSEEGIILNPWGSRSC